MIEPSEQREHRLGSREWSEGASGKPTGNVTGPEVRYMMSVFTPAALNARLCRRVTLTQA